MTAGTNTMCLECSIGFRNAADNKSCIAVPSEEQTCLVGFEKNNNQISCLYCDYRNNFFSVDSVHALPPNRQRQICAKQGGGSMMIIIIVVILVIVIAVVAVMFLRKGKSGNEAELKGSMISKN